MTTTLSPSYSLPPPSEGMAMALVDEITSRASADSVFGVVRDVEGWARHLEHYRYVRLRSKSADGGLVEMAANRPFGPVNWPTWWLSEMSICEKTPYVRFRHVGGITKGMEVEWAFHPAHDGGTHVRLVHVWNGPRWPLLSEFAAVNVIGPHFVHAIASRTMAGLSRTAEQRQGIST